MQITIHKHAKKYTELEINEFYLKNKTTLQFVIAVTFLQQK